MPIDFEFEKREIPAKSTPGSKPIPTDVLDAFRKVVADLKPSGEEGLVKLKDKKELALARRALQEAGIQEKKWVRVRKQRGSEATLVVQRITKAEWDEAQRKAKARGAKLRGRRKAARGETAP